MRTIQLLVAVALVLATASSAFAQRNLGFTDTQILKMGVDKWMDLFANRVGSSTADMNEAMAAYTRSLSNRNSNLIAKMPKAAQQPYRDLREILASYGSNSGLLQYFLAGGGTMYSLIGSGNVLNAEEVVYKLLTGTGSNAPKRTTSQIQTQFPIAGRLIADHEMTDTGMSRQHAERVLRQMEDAFARGVRIAAKRPRRDSDLILDYFYRNIKSVTAPTM